MPSQCSYNGPASPAELLGPTARLAASLAHRFAFGSVALSIITGWLRQAAMPRQCTMRVL